MVWVDNVNLDIDIGFGSGPLAASPSWTDVSTDVRGVTIDRGRVSTNDTFDAGIATIILDNSGGDYDPNNSASPHTGDLNIGTPVRIQATHDATTYDLFYGSVTRWPLAYEGTFDGIVELEVTENLAILGNTFLDGFSESEESSDTRIGNILDDASWAAGARDLDTGVSDVAAYAADEYALTLIAEAVSAEQGEFFIAKNGDATFLNRTAKGSLTSSSTFGPGGGELDYMTIRLLYDDDLLINYAAITGPDEILATSSDATSIATYGERAWEATNLQLLGEPYAQNVADWIVGKNKDMVVRVTGFTISPEVDPSNLWPEVLDRELQDVITVKYTPPAGDSLNQEVAVEGISHRIVPGYWEVAYTCHPLSTLEQTDFWILGTSELDTETALA